MFGSLGRSGATSEGAEHRRASLPGVDTIKLRVKKLVRGVISEDLSRQVVDDIAKNQDIVSAVIVYATDG